MSTLRELLERLRARHRGETQSGTLFSLLVNPDGPEAADAIASLLDKSDEADRLAAENARLREAVEPFAKAAEQIDGEGRSVWIEKPADDGYITLNDLRRAQAALSTNAGRKG